MLTNTADALLLMLLVVVALSLPQAQSLALQKELELQILKHALASSELEGSRCLEALATAIDIVADSDAMDSNSGDILRSSAELAAGTCGIAAAAGAMAASQPGQSEPESAAAAPGQPQPQSWHDAAQVQQLEQQLLRLQQDSTVLQQHNREMQSCLAQAAEQLDVMEARSNGVVAEKELVLQQLQQAEQQLQLQVAEREEFYQEELDEQQQQHEEEVRALHGRLAALTEEKQAVEAELKRQAQAVEQLEQQLLESQACQRQVQEELQQVQQQLVRVQVQLDSSKSEAAASVEQLTRQVRRLLLSSEQYRQVSNASRQVLKCSRKIAHAVMASRPGCTAAPGPVLVLP